MNSSPDVSGTNLGEGLVRGNRATGRWLVGPIQSCISQTHKRADLGALAFSDGPDGRSGSVLRLPHPVRVLRHALPVILESVIAPVAAYDFVLLLAGFRGALLAALAWSYFLVARRMWRRERVSTLLLPGTALLTLRTVISFVTGSAFVYFIQPTVSAFLASTLLVLSALAGRPFTQRFTHRFLPTHPRTPRRARASTASWSASPSFGR